MHQIVWIVRWRAVSSSFCVVAGHVLGFWEGAILTGELTNPRDPSSAEIPCRCREAGHCLAPRPLCLIRAEGPVDVWLGCGARVGEIEGPYSLGLFAICRGINGV